MEEKEDRLKKIVFFAGFDKSFRGKELLPSISKLIDLKGWQKIYNSGMGIGQIAADERG